MDPEPVLPSQASQLLSEVEALSRRWGSEQFLRSVPDYRASAARRLILFLRWRSLDKSLWGLGRYRTSASRSLRTLARLVGTEVLTRRGRPLSDAEREHVAAVVRQAAYLNEREAIRAGNRGAALTYALGGLAAALVSAAAALAWGRTPLWALAFFGVQVLALAVWRLLDDGFSGDIILVGFLWGLIGLGAGVYLLAAPAPDPLAGLLLALLLAGLSLDLFVLLLLLWQILAAWIPGLAGTGRRDPYPLLVEQLLGAVGKLGGLTLALDQGAESLYQTCRWITSQELKRKNLSASSAFQLLESCLVASQDDHVLGAATAAVEAVVGDQRVVTVRRVVDDKQIEEEALVPHAAALPPTRYIGPMRDPERCQAIVRDVEEAAAAMQSDLARTAGDLGPEARDLLSVLGRRVAAWLRAQEAELLVPSVSAPQRVRRALAEALVAACFGDWRLFQAEAEPAPFQERAPSRVWRRASVRVLPVLGVLTAMWLVPWALDMSAQAATTFRGALVLPAIAALFAPAQAFTDAGKALSDLRTPRRTGDDQVPGQSP